MNGNFVEILLTQPVVIALAILGAGASMAATALRAKGRIGPDRAKQLNTAGYACMGASMLLFIIAGFRA